MGSLILATLVGAIALAGAVDDPGLSDEIVERVARILHRHVQGECAPSAAIGIAHDPGIPRPAPRAEERDAKFGR